MHFGLALVTLIALQVLINNQQRWKISITQVLRRNSQVLISTCFNILKVSLLFYLIVRLYT